MKLKGKLKIQPGVFSPVVFFMCVLFFVFVFFAGSVIAGNGVCRAEEIVLLYTGDTHAMLYPCHCVLEPDGGVARRAGLIEDIRKQHPNVLLLDTGGFFAGGVYDEYSRNAHIDMERTRVQTKSMAVMKYDAVTVGADEFNFGEIFFKENICADNIPVVACNILSADAGESSDDCNSRIFKPYIVVERGGLKIGIIGVTSFDVLKKTAGFVISDPKSAVKQAVLELQAQSVGFIILLSRLDEKDSKRILEDISGVDIVISGNTKLDNSPSNQAGEVLFLRPSWQGRRMGKAVLTVRDGKIVDSKVEEVRLSDKVEDDKRILSVLPQCFSDSDCKQSETLVADCKNAGSSDSCCVYSHPNPVRLFIVTPKKCKSCEMNIRAGLAFLKKHFSGLKVSYIRYPGSKARKIIKDFNIETLPAYLLGKEVRLEKDFYSLSDKLRAKGDFYMVDPQVSGIAYLLQRERKKDRLDLFISLYDKNSSAVLSVLKDLNPEIHFLAMKRGNGFDARSGMAEVEEYLRCVCVKKYYPHLFRNYVACRAAKIDSTWWEDCAIGIDAAAIKDCACSPEAKELLQENIGLSEELRLMFGPAYLINNQEIFGSRGIPDKNELLRMLKGK